MLENVSITVDDNVPWEIASDESTKQLPHIVNVQCSFKPIQDFLPRRINEELDNTNIPFITDTKESYVSLEEHQVMIKNEDRISKDLQGLPEAKPLSFKSTEFLSEFEKSGIPYKPKGLSNTFKTPG